MSEIIVDGYNVLHCVDRYRALLERDVAAARSKLVNDLTAIAAEGISVTVVFDGAGNPEADGTPMNEGGVSVRFSPTGVEADTIVEAMAKAAPAGAGRVLVVTSDTATANAVMGGSVRVISATGFIEDLDAGFAEAAETSPFGRSKSTVEDRLSDESRATLLRMRRSRP